MRPVFERPKSDNLMCPVAVISMLYKIKKDVY